MGKLLLLEEIEACRAEMISLYSSHELTSDTVITASEKLDELINEFQNYNKYELASN